MGEPAALRAMRSGDATARTSANGRLRERDAIGSSIAVRDAVWISTLWAGVFVLAGMMTIKLIRRGSRVHGFTGSQVADPEPEHPRT